MRPISSAELPSGIVPLQQLHIYASVSIIFCLFGAGSSVLCEPEGLERPVATVVPEKR